jgi:phenylacetate-CoA ligase
MRGWIRRVGFWGLDALRGGHIRRHYQEVKSMNDTETCNTAQLQKLLDHAVRTTAFYRACDPNDFDSFPVLTKNDLKTRWNDICSEAFSDKLVYTTSTSGSTGIPLEMKWNADKRARQLAEMVYFYEGANHRLGERFVFFRENQNKKTKSRIKQWQQNMYDYDVTSFDDEKMSEIYRLLTKKPYIQCYIAYGSFHEAFIKYLRKQPSLTGRFHTESIVTSSEVFSMESKEELHALTGAKVFDRYSNEENGFIAQSENLSDSYWVNTASFKVEILKQDEDAPAAEGEVGRIVVTDLYNFSVPLIRYDTGDLSIRQSEKNGWTMQLKTIQGRRSDIIYNTRGAQMTTSVWNAYMGDFKQLKQYQLIQEAAKVYRLKVNGAKGIYTDEEMTAALRKAIGSDAVVIIEHVEGIPALSSGKFKKTICNYEFCSDDYC